LNDQGSSSLIKTLRCKSCGGPLKPSAESILSICNFCGEISAESDISPHTIIKPLPLTPPEGMGHVKKMELILIPFFEIKADVSLDALGYQRRERTETKTVRRGGETVRESKTIVEYRPWRVQHQGSHNVRFLARQEVTVFGAGELISTVAHGVGGEAMPFSPELIKSIANMDPTRSTLVALSPEWDQQNAARKAGEIVYEAAYARAKSEMHEVFDTRVKFTPISAPTLLHEPLLLIRRQIQGRSYRAAYHWGNGKLLKEERPIKNRRLGVFFALLMFLAGPVLVQLGFDIYTNSGDDAVWVLILLGVVALGLAIGAIVILIRVYRPHKLYSSGTRLSLFDFQRISQEERAAVAQAQQAAAKPKQPKFCPKCGDPLEPNQTFCEKCGYKMEV